MYRLREGETIMEYFIIGIIVVVVVVGGFLLWKSRQKNDVIIKQNIDITKSDVDTDELNQLVIQLEQLPAEALTDESKLMEITDSRVLARVNNLVPELFKVGNAAGNAVQAVQANGQVLYQAIIPSGAKLANSKDMAGAVRGIYHGAKGVKGHANLIAVKQKANVATNVAASAMGVVSIVVGQYYMKQINAELDEINDGIKKIADFQNNEYKSKVFALVAQIQKVTKFQVDILENDELRLSEIDNLNRWEQQCIELLGQANLSISGYAKKKNIDYKSYKKEIAQAQNWFVYQKTLMEVMIKIAELRHTLNLGAVSREQCGALLHIYSKQVQGALEQLAAWHKAQIKKFKINVDKSRKKRMGWDRAAYLIPGLINRKNNFRPISNKMVKNIVDQVKGYATPHNIDAIDLFQKDVKIIAKERKIYYFPQEVAE